LNKIIGNSLEFFFEPKSVAVIGASQIPGKIGHELLRNLMQGGFEGNIFPVNPNARSILGITSYKSVIEIPSSVDLGIVVVPAELVESVTRDCVAKGVKGVIIITSGFSEVGNKELEERILEAAKGRLRIVGPNTFGIFYAGSKMNATFGPTKVLKGHTAFISQSGALGLALMDWTTEEKYGVSSIVSIGNKSDVDDADLIEHFSTDPLTKSILIYMEGLKDGRKFYEIAMRVTRKKPIVVIKAGRSKRGAQAASSHTGAIAGQDAVFSAAFEQAGIVRAESMTQAFDWIQAINGNPVPNGENLAIVTNGGGVGVLATDRCESLGLSLMDISSDLANDLKRIMPSFGSVKNPIDITANADDVLYEKVLQVLFRSDDVDSVIALFCQTANIDPVLFAQAIISSRKRQNFIKPLTCALIGGHLSTVAYSTMLEGKFAAYPTAERAVDSMYALTTRYRQLNRWKEKTR
jgi:acetyl-CoA synthetase (ADP-forming)